jgi:uncharacterized protein (DUF983 family)
MRFHLSRRAPRRAPHRPVSRTTAILRGVRGHCPRCGGGRIFASLNELHDRCPTCGLAFVREDGYWLGAMSVAIGLVELVFGVFFVGGMLLTWPDVPWTALLVFGLAINAALPLFGYGWSKTLWLGIDHAFFPTTTTEEAEAIIAHEAGRLGTDRDTDAA